MEMEIQNCRSLTPIMHQIVLCVTKILSAPSCICFHQARHGPCSKCIQYIYSKPFTINQYNTVYGKEHWKAAKQVLRYLKGTSTYELILKKSNYNLESFADAVWAVYLDDRKSYMDYVFLLAGAPLSRKARKPTITLSTTEIWLSDASKEVI